jgi:hypothetical protein
VDSIEHGTPAPQRGAADDRLSRGELLRRGAALVGGAAGCSLLWSSTVHADDVEADDTNDELDFEGWRGPRPVGPPRPIPGGLAADFSGYVPVDGAYHFYIPAIGSDMSTITDFKGVIAGCELQGTAHGSDGSAYWFDADMRFMDGVYIDLHGRRRHHAFGFV